MTIQRRNLFAGAAGLIGAGLVPTARAAAGSCKGLPAKYDLTVDVAVIGAGGAGLNAAIQAHDAGAKTIIINKGASSYHSATAICGGGFAAWGTKDQQKANVPDTPEKFAQDVIDFGNYQNNRELVMTWARNSGKCFDWMADRGLAAHRLENYQGHNQLRYERQLNYTGRDYIDVLVREAEARKIEVRAKSPLSRIFYDEETNTVLGVAFTGPDGKETTVRTLKGIVLATGGFTGDPKFFDLWGTNLGSHGVCIGAPTNDGKAMMIAVRDCSTPLSHMQYFASYPCGIQVRNRNGCFHRYWYVVDAGGILVNKLGKRFCMERLGQTKVGELLLRQPDNCHFTFVDAEGWEQAFRDHPANALFALPAWNKERVDEEIDLGRIIFKGDTIEEVAAKAGVDPKGLKATVAEWNASVEKKSDPAFGRRPEDMKRKLGKGPFYMTRMTFWANLTCGGLRVNGDVQVLNWNNEPIRGFFAAGETVAGAHGNSFLGGDAVSFACTSGFVAGQNVVKLAG